MNSNTVNPDSYRRGKWQWGLSGLLVLFAVWRVLPGEIWPQSQEAGAVALQSDGKIVAVASGGFAVARYHLAGSPDSSFGVDGKVVTRFGTVEEEELGFYAGAGWVTLQGDGKIVAAGRVDNSFAVARYLPDGSLDASFGSGGKVTTRIGTDPEIEDELHALALQADGKIVVAGRTWQRYSNDFALVRYKSDGRLDPSFGAGGIVTTDFTPASPSPSLGPILAPQGKQRTIMRADPATSLPLGPSYDDAFVVALQTDGKLVVGGTSLARYNPDGSLDPSFGASGQVRTEARALALQRDGKIVAIGAAGTFALARYNSDGSRDANFGSGGTVTTQIGRVDAAGDVALQPDGKLVVVGTSFDGRSINFAMVRYNPDGSLDYSFGTGGQVTSDFCAHTVEEQYAQSIGAGSISGGWRVGLQTDGKIVVTGTPSSVLCHGFVLFRYNPDGSPDASFGKNGRVTTTIVTNDGYAYALAIQVDEKIMAAGTSIGGFAVARYNPDGSLDPSFGAGGKVTTRIGAGYMIW